MQPQTFLTALTACATASLPTSAAHLGLHIGQCRQARRVVWQDAGGAIWFGAVSTASVLRLLRSASCRNHGLQQLAEASGPAAPGPACAATAGVCRPQLELDRRLACRLSDCS